MTATVVCGMLTQILCEIVMKIALLGFELPGLECRQLKKIKNKEKTLAKYRALLASLPSRLNNW